MPETREPQRYFFDNVLCIAHTYTQGIVICSLIFLEDVLKEEGDCDEEGELGLVAIELLNLFVVH